MFTLATFNVKDLFDPAFTAKLDEIAGHVARADADVVAFQEIGSEEAFSSVLARVPRGDEYKTRIIGPPDRRGIRNALITRAKVLHEYVHTAREVEFPVFVQGDPAPFPGRIPLRRGVVQAQVDAPGIGPIDIFVAHFKSKRATRLLLPDGTEVEPSSHTDHAEAEIRSLMSRAAEALFLRRLVDETELKNPRIAVLGDLNDTIESVPVRIVKGRGDGRLHSASSIIVREERFSVIHNTWREQIDHILVSQVLRDALASAAFMNAGLKDGGPHIENPPPTVESDHALFLARFHNITSPPSDPAASTQRSG
jgi:endonuclease/exonuclease/phosphatase family metal-dependent hydrolase